MSENIAPESLTLQHIAKWTGEDMRAQLVRPGMREAIMALLKDRSWADVQKAATGTEGTVVATSTPEEEAEAARVAAEAEAKRVADEAEAARVAAEAARPKKFSIDYQVKDEDGNPIGRPTHLEAPTEEALREKLVEAHTQATRAFHRLKTQKLTFKQQQQQPAQVEKPMTDAELSAALVDIRSDDPKKAFDAQIRVTQEERRKAAEEREAARQAQVSYAFLKKHIADYNNCEANNQALHDYIKENQLEWTLDNLEIAFIAKGSELAEVVKPVVPAPSVNPAPAATPAVTTSAAVPVVQPTLTAPAQVVPPANPVGTAPRPGVNGGIVPGQTSGVRPAAKQTGITVEEIKSWDGPTMRMKMQNPAIRAQIEKLARERSEAGLTRRGH